MIIGEFHLDKPCRKRTVIAFLVASEMNYNRVYFGSNWCETPVKPGECPRKDMATGVGYELCKQVCNQRGHAETEALRLAGEDAIGATVYIVGHRIICEGCIEAMNNAKVKEWVILN